MNLAQSHGQLAGCKPHERQVFLLGIGLDGHVIQAALIRRGALRRAMSAQPVMDETAAA